MVFTVERSGEYYRFYNQTYGYLCANGTGNNAFYSLTASEDADWLVRECSGNVGGYEMESRTAKYNGKYSQWLEYYSDSFKVYSMYSSTGDLDYTIYSFSFYPVAEGTELTGGIVNMPAVVIDHLYDAYVGQAYTFSFTVDAPFGVKGDMTATLAGEALTVTEEEGCLHRHHPRGEGDGRQTHRNHQRRGQSGQGHHPHRRDPREGRAGVLLIPCPCGALRPAATSGPPSPWRWPMPGRSPPSP